MIFANRLGSVAEVPRDSGRDGGGVVGLERSGAGPGW